MSERTARAKSRSPDNTYTIRYALLGAAFGLIFPLVAALILLLEAGLPTSLMTMAETLIGEPLLWIIATAPFFLGLFAALAGRREDRLQRSKAQLQEMVISLEERVTDRTRDLDRAVEVGHSVTQVTDLDQMLAEAVELIRSSFNLYYVQVYLVDAGNRNLVLHAGTGAVGAAMVTQSQRIPVGLGTIAGAAVVEKQTIVVANTANSRLFQPNPLLPDTWSEMVMPLLIGDRIVGVLDLQSDKPGRLTTENLPALEAVAGQLAIAVEHARLVAEATEARTEMAANARRMARTGWQDFLNALDRGEYMGYAYDSEKTIPINERLPEILNEETLYVPITVTGQPIGSITVQGLEDKRWSEEEAHLAAAVADQVARQVENLRLLAEADRFRAEAEAATRRLTREGWDHYLDTQDELQGGFIYDLNTVKPIAVEQDAARLLGPVISEVLSVRGEPLGRLEVTKTGEPDDEASELVAAVAEQLSIHLENLRLTEQTEQALAETEEQARRLNALNELSQDLASATTLDEVFTVAAKRTANIIPSDRTNLALVRAPGESFEILVLEGDRGVTRMGDAVINKGSALGLAVEENRLIVVNNTGASSMAGISSFMVAPLRAGGRVLGTLNVGRTASAAYDRADEQLLLQVASLLASSIESRRLFSETEKRAGELAILNEMGRVLTSLANVDSITQTIYDHTIRLIDAGRFFVALRDPGRQQITIRQFGGEADDATTQTGGVDRDLVAYLFEIGQPLLLAENIPDRLAELGLVADGWPAESYMAVPMITGNQVTGVLAVQLLDRLRTYDRHDLGLLTAVAGQAAIAIENTRLFEQVQARAQRERILREVTARVRGTADVDSVMRTAAKEVGRALGRQAFVFLSDGEQEPPVDEVEES